MASSSGFSFLRDMSDRVRATAADASSVLQPKVRAASRSLSTSLAEATANLRLGDLPGTGGGSSALYAGEPELAATMATLDATREGLRATGAAVAKHRAALLAVADAQRAAATALTAYAVSHLNEWALNLAQAQQATAADTAAAWVAVAAEAAEAQDNS
ncbi:hypothetical protein I4F81_001532 [Pyropia yezoensis]|uniref:Uncharacterized protein n=1 Tax=Pyropia yezoensis TaxID=2788 RepID=A0ACC3BMX2_PYRYE|nr:hypothetical protein I4F81_001532 [Neopyropia yezoensis]